MGLCVSGHEVRTEKAYHLLNFIAGMQLIASNAHQRKALSVRGHLKMRRLLFIFTIFPLCTMGQTILFDIEKIGDSLKTVGIDTFIVYQNYFPGSIAYMSLDRNDSEDQLHDTFCENSDAVYILYRQNAQTCIKKRNECYTYKTVYTDTSKAFSFFLAHVDKIVNEKILNHSYLDKNGDTLLVTMDHSDITKMYIACGTIKKIITIDWFDFYSSNNSMNESNENMNYNHNINTTTKDLVLLISDKTRQTKFTKE